MLVSGGKDGKILLLSLAGSGGAGAGGIEPRLPIGSTGAAPPSPSKKGPRIVHSRQIELTATIDLMAHADIIAYSIRSLFLSADAAKVLVGTFTGGWVDQPRLARFATNI